METTTADLTSTDKSQHHHDQKETITDSDHTPLVKNKDVAAIVSSNVFNRNFLVIVISAAVGGVFLVLIAFVVAILLVLTCIWRRKQSGKKSEVNFYDEIKTIPISGQQFM